MRLGLRTWVAAAIVLVALAVRLPGIDHGLPYGYEEAVPLKRAWTMAGWGDAPLDLNPHFFHYPSLAFYTQLAGQAVLFAGLRTAGGVDSVREFRTRYHTDPGPFYLTGRAVSVLFALVTVLALAALAARTSVPHAPLLAALLLALNVFHILRSQMIEVDIPLTAFVTIALAAMVRLVQTPSRRAGVLAGIAVGLAASSKYTGAILIVPLAASYLLAHRRNTARAPWTDVTVSVAAAAVAFAVTSPYVLLDFSAFRSDLGLERTHMALGHFGTSGGPTWLFYLESLGSRVAGWPALALCVVGMVVSGIRRRRPWATITSIFLITYLIAISVWKMAADRYALPLLPAIGVLGLAGAWETARLLARGSLAQRIVLVVLAAVMAAPGLWQLDGFRQRLESDSRTTAFEWIETNVSAGSLIVTESYGPPLFGPLDYWSVAPDIRRDVYRTRAAGGFRGVMPIPLFQAEPEKTAPYYDVSLYRAADVIVTTGSVRGRYEGAPERFPAQAHFYDALDDEFELVYTVEASGGGSRIYLYRSRRHERPFAERPAGPIPAFAAPALPPWWRAWFYYRLGLNHEAFGHVQRALECYQRGWPDAVSFPETYRQTAFGIVRALHLLDRDDEVPALIAQMVAAAPRPADAVYVESLAAGNSR